MTEWTSNHVQQTCKKYFLCLNGNGSRLNLGEIENVGNKIEQVRSGAVNGAGKLNLFAGQVTIRIIRELLAQDENTVERGSQLMRHIGKEFRFVLGSESK